MFNMAVRTIDWSNCDIDILKLTKHAEI